MGMKYEGKYRIRGLGFVYGNGVRGVQLWKLLGEECPAIFSLILCLEL